MARLFVAVWPPNHTLDHLAGLPRADDSAVRWTTRDQWHVTLRFVGDEDPDRLSESLSKVEATATTATVGPRVRLLGDKAVVVPVAGLDELAVSVRRSTDHLGGLPDPRPFVGHITLARLRRGGSCGLTGATVDDTFEVSEVALVASETHPDGARYTDLARFPLERQ